MKRLLPGLLLMCCSALCFGQKNLVSYDDIKYLLHNNLLQADTFLMAKGYIIAKKDNNNKNRKYTLTTKSDTYSNINMRSDGKRIFIEIETDEIDQYNLIRESISQYLVKTGTATDVQSYTVKDLGDIYITIDDTVPYNPLKRDYDIQILGDKHITAYN
jgi:predicted house-cleaning NTP pyrophosphatase (Maf/HAM1 superfamily)